MPFQKKNRLAEYDKPIFFYLYEGIYNRKASSLRFLNKSYATNMYLYIIS